MKPKNIADSVMQEIKQKHIKMKPKWYFATITALSLLTILSTATALIYSVRLIAIGLNIYFSNVPRYGIRQQFEYSLANFPWWSIIAAVVFAVALIWITRQQSNLYKVRTSQLVTIIIVFIIIIGLIFSLTDTKSREQHQQRGKNQQSSIQYGKKSRFL